ncbi:MAG: hypothetical protein WAS27_02525 [Candidatus Saccharimonadales bacterium]
MATNSTLSNWCEQLVERGARGELIAHPSFLALRTPDKEKPFLYGTFGALSVVSLIGFVSGAFSTIALLFIYAAWMALGYVYVALGTPMSRAFLTRVCVAGVVVSAFCMIFAAVGMVLAVQYLPEMIVSSVLRVVFYVVMIVLFWYVYKYTARATRRLDIGS